MSSPKLDIFINSINRGICLDSILRNINKYLSGYRKIYVFYQATTQQYLLGYQKLIKDVKKNKKFKQISKKIIFKRKYSLSESTVLLKKYIKTKYILVVGDDTIIFNKFNLTSSDASKKFFADKDIISCSLRYGFNSSDQVPSNRWHTNIIKKDFHNKANAVFFYGKPNFLFPKKIDHLDFLDKKKQHNYILWNWVENQNSYFSSIINPSLQIFRSDQFLNWLNKFGNKSFLDITSVIEKEYYPIIFKKNRLLFLFGNIFDYIYHLHCKKNKNIRPSHIFKNFLISYLVKTKKINMPQKIICPRDQIGLDYDIGSHHLNKKTRIYKKLNDYYLKNYFLDFQKETKNFNLPCISISNSFLIKKFLKKNEKKFSCIFR